MRAQEDTTTRIETGQTQRNAGRMPRGLRDSAHWLIAKNQNGHIEVLTIRCGREKALPIFSFEEEAEMFLRLGSVGEHWRLRESRAGELLSVLYGACASVKKVALDPLPEMAADGSVDLVSLDRRLFIERIMAGQGGPSIPADGRVFRRPATHLLWGGHLRTGKSLLPLEEVVELLRYSSTGREEEHADRQAIEKLTPRAIEVLQALAEGLKSEEIAEGLNIALGTERNHMASILKKLKVHSQLQALLFALRQGVVEIS